MPAAAKLFWQILQRLAQKSLKEFDTSHLWDTPEIVFCVCVCIFAIVGADTLTFIVGCNL